MPDLDLSPAFSDLIFFALDHGVDLVRDSGGPLLPFVVTSSNGERSLNVFATESLEESMAAARQFLAQLPAGAEAFAFAYDGFVTVEGVRTDAILVESGA